MILMPLPNTSQISGTALVVDDERHDIVSQAFLEQDESAHAAIAVLEGEDLLEPDMEIQDMISLNFSLVLVAGNQFS